MEGGGLARLSATHCASRSCTEIAEMSSQWSLVDAQGLSSTCTEKLVDPRVTAPRCPVLLCAWSEVLPSCRNAVEG